MTPSGIRTPGAILLSLALAGCASRGLVPASRADQGSRRTPILSWNSFPTPDYERLRDRMTKVTYEVRIWEAYSPARYEWTRDRQTYSRSGLLDPIHQVEEPLVPDMNYVWAVRARFELDGEVRVTPWSTADGWDRESELPERGYARICIKRN